MDPERWSDFVRAFVDELGSKTDGLIIDVSYTKPYWLVKVKCPCCKTEVQWTLLGGEPKPAPATIPLPAWVAKLNDLPPGGTT